MTGSSEDLKRSRKTVVIENNNPEPFERLLALWNKGSMDVQDILDMLYSRPPANQPILKGGHGTTSLPSRRGPD